MYAWKDIIGISNQNELGQTYMSLNSNQKDQVSCSPFFYDWLL